MTVYLTPEQVLFVHYRVLHETGGQSGVRELSALRSALAAPTEMKNGQEVFAGLYKKSAVLMDTFIKQKPFNDANKRTAIAAVDLFLRINGQRVGTDNAEMVRFVRKCAASSPSLEFMTAWFWQYARPLTGRNT